VIRKSIPKSQNVFTVLKIKENLNHDMLKLIMIIDQWLGNPLKSSFGFCS